MAEQKRGENAGKERDDVDAKAALRLGERGVVVGEKEATGV